MDLNEIAIFARVVEKGSFTAAAESLGLPKSNVSRKVASLERSLGTTLLRRTTRKLSLTDAGTAYFHHAQRVVQEMAAGEQALQQMQSAPHGLLRIAVSVGFGVAFLGGVVAEYLKRFDDVRAELVMSNDLPESLQEGIDLAVRVGPLADSSLMARHLGSLRRVLCASPDYLERRGEPVSPHDLLNHDCLLFPADARDGRTWVLNGPNGSVEAAITGRLVANNLAVIHQAALEGVGIALLPQFRSAADIRAGRLVPVLCNWEPPMVDVHVVYPPDQHPLPKVSAFISLLRESMTPPPWDTGLHPVS
jgi:DNA-binding transcriptional LysR family regulator